MVQSETSASTQNAWRLELATGILLGLAAVVAAWASYQSALWSGDQQFAYGAANLRFSRANALLSEGDRAYLQDLQTLLAYIEAGSNGNTEVAKSIREELMSGRVKASLAAYERAPQGSRDNPVSLSNPVYDLDSFDQARAVMGEVDDLLDRANESGTIADRLNFITVLLAGALFILGVSASFNFWRLQVFALGIGASLLVFSTIWMLSLGTRNPFV